MMARRTLLVLTLLGLTAALPRPAQAAAGPVGVELFAGGGYRHSLFAQGGGLDFSVGLDIRVAFLLIGVEIRPSPGFSAMHRLQGLVNLSFFIPSKVVRPYLQLSGGGGALFNPEARASGVLRQALGVDFFIKKFGIGVKAFVDETAGADMGIDLGLGGQLELRLRL